MNLPNLSDFYPDQINALLAPADENLFIVGPPGSGKTTIAVQRAKNISYQGKRTLLITKNRMLASLARKLGEQSFEVMTMNKFVPTDYGIRFNKLIPKSPYNSYQYDWDLITAHYEHSPTPSYDHIIVDEGQNIPARFYPWVVKFGAHNVSIFADENQTTENSEHASLEDIRSAPMPAAKHLIYNHRNTYEIAQVAEFFHRSLRVGAGIVPDERRGEKPALVSFDNWEDISKKITNRFRNRKSSIGIIVENIDIAQTLYNIITRHLHGTTSRIDLYTHRAPEYSEYNIDISQDGITILTSKSVIGLEFDCVYLQDLPRQANQLSLATQRRMYMLCARAKKELFLIDGPQALTKAQLTNLPDENLLTR